MGMPKARVKQTGSGTERTPEGFGEIGRTQDRDVDPWLDQAPSELNDREIRLCSTLASSERVAGLGRWDIASRSHLTLQ